ncbi:hypothetical protein [Falsiroseomonas sp. E2-1-a20]|uniref:hypothetical protein n=1 Tax=Falsiroseomonas sp. E2-1-a20 TaxID=3239300 RepID=UPI003F3EEAB0
MASGLPAIEATLRAIQAAMVRHPAFLAPPGTNPGDPDHTDNQAQIDKLRRDLNSALQQLKSRSDMLDLRKQIAVRQPRQQRWRTNQSIRDQSSALSRVYGLAVDILSQLEALQQSNLRPSIPQIIQHFLQEANDQNEMVSALVQQHKGHYDALCQPTTTVQNIPVGFLIAIVIAWLGIMREKLSRQ